MPRDLAGHKDGHAERFSAEAHSGRLIEAEHRTRYRWASQVVAGKAVLDAGCGTAYGSRVLAEAGAKHVTGVDIAQSVLEAVAPEMPDNVTLQAGDLHALGFEDEYFDVVVCFEVIEHFPDPEAILAELCRVLGPSGLLLISSPNRGIFPGGNPHHHHEFLPEELRAALSERFRNVHLTHQQVYLLSATLEDEDFLAGTGRCLSAIEIEKMAGDSPDSELYTLAVASNATLPELTQVAALTGSVDYRDWLELFQAQRDTIRDREAAVAELEAVNAKQRELTGLLADAEQQLAAIPLLTQRVESLSAELRHSRAVEEAGRKQIHELERRLTESAQIIADLVGSPSWKVTRPLRDAKRLLAR